MGWEGYVPARVWDKYGNSEHMKNAVKCYGLLRKHEGADSATLMLFDCLSDAQLGQQQIQAQLVATRSYIEDIEGKLGAIMSKVKT